MRRIHDQRGLEVRANLGARVAHGLERPFAGSVAIGEIAARAEILGEVATCPLEIAVNVDREILQRKGRVDARLSIWPTQRRRA